MGGVPGRTVLQDPNALVQAGVLDAPIEFPEGATYADAGRDRQPTSFEDEGWVPLDEADPAFGQAGSEAGVLLEETGAFAAGEFQVINVFDTGGERYPKINDSLDFLAFFHDPHYAVVEVAPLEPTRTEPGRAPATAGDRRDPPAPVRLHGPRPRRPAPAGGVLTVGAGIIFLTLCWLLHRRERFVRRQPRRQAVPATERRASERDR